MLAKSTAFRFLQDKVPEIRAANTKIFVIPGILKLIRVGVNIRFVIQLRCAVGPTAHIELSACARLASSVSQRPRVRSGSARHDLGVPTIKVSAKFVVNGPHQIADRRQFVG